MTRIIAREILELHRSLGIPEEYGAGLPCFSVPGELVDVGLDAYKRPQQLEPLTAKAWASMVAAAAVEDVGLILVSGFRGYAYQAKLIERKVARGEPLHEVLKVVAAPGFSEHHSGRAIDLTIAGTEPLAESFEQTRAFAWLSGNALDFGFSLSYPRDNPYGFIYEPWHWAYAKEAMPTF